MGFFGKMFVVGAVASSAKKIKEKISRSKNRKDGNEYIKVSTFIYDLIGGNYKDAKESLEGHGFTNVSLVAKRDLKRRLKKKLFFRETNDYENGEVEEISINGEIDFDKNDQFLPTAKVTIVYHTFRESDVEEGKGEYINVSNFIDDLYGENYEVVKDRLESYGFTNISFIAKKDLKKDLKKRFIFSETNEFEDGEVEDISINGETDFEEIDHFLSTARVVIIYHTYPGGETSGEKSYARCSNCKASFEYKKSKPVCPYCGEPIE